jgi:hypothetical protein
MLRYPNIPNEHTYEDDYFDDEYYNDDPDWDDLL